MLEIYTVRRQSWYRCTKCKRRFQTYERAFKHKCGEGVREWLKNINATAAETK